MCDLLHVFQKKKKTEIEYIRSRTLALTIGGEIQELKTLSFPHEIVVQQFFL